jgi:hypothetical protein
MKEKFLRFFVFATFGVLVFFPMALAGADTPTMSITSRDVEIDGVKLHYMTAGNGTPLILLHGYAETSRMWRPIIPLLAERFKVIAPDLPGIGDSGIPKDGLDMKTAAITIHDLAPRSGCRERKLWGTTSASWSPMRTPRSFPPKRRNWS